MLLRFFSLTILTPLLLTNAIARAQTQPGESDEIRALRAEMAARVSEMQSQISALQKRLDALDAAGMADAYQPTRGSSTTTKEKLNNSATYQPQVVGAEPNTDVAPIIAENAGLASISENQTLERGSSTMRLGHLNITPGGFLALESVYRSKAVGADLSTPYALTPFAGAGLARQSEWTPSGRQSRASVLIQAKTGLGRISGYYEADFLQAGSNTNSVQTSSYVLRQRQVFLSLGLRRGWTVSGGQMWTLATENLRGVDPRTEAIPLIIDGAQSVGFTWGRWAGLRVSKTINRVSSVALSFEQPQIVFSATNAPKNFFIGTPGSAPGAFNPDVNYSIHSSPDFILKASFDPLRIGHYELGLIGRIFRDRYYPDAGAPRNDTNAAGGLFASARFPIGSRLEIGAKIVGGRGLGRYGSSTLPEVTVKPDGTLSPLQNAQAFLRIEYRASGRLNVFAYQGTEYAGRASYRGVNGIEVGYGIRNGDNTGCLKETPPTTNSGYDPSTPINCVGANRSVSEWSGGFQYRFYEGPAGRLQFSTVYGRVERNAWSGVGGAPDASNHLVYTGLRYILP